MIERAARWALVCVASLALAACGGGEGQSERQVTVQDTEFAVGEPSPWLTYQAVEPIGCDEISLRAEPSGNSYAISRSPWWIDPNHSAPGLGYLNLVAFAYHHDFSVDGSIVAPRPGRPLDLRNARVLVRWRSAGLVLPESARLMFWFQTDTAAAGAMPRRVNYVLSARPLAAVSQAGLWQQDELELGTRSEDYTCLGSNPLRTATYGCDIDPATALRDWNVDLGFVIVFADQSVAQGIQGAIEFDRIMISVPESNIETHALAPVTLVRDEWTCRIPPT